MDFDKNEKIKMEKQNKHICALLEEVKAMCNAVDQLILCDTQLRECMDDAQFCCAYYFDIIKKKINTIERMLKK